MEPRTAPQVVVMQPEATREIKFSGFPLSCPPESAVPPDQEVYRFVWTDPPTDVDYKSKHQQRELKKVKCNDCSLSVFGSFETARARLQDLRNKAEERSSPYQRLIAVAIVGPSHGKIGMRNPLTDHSEFWVCDGVDVLPMFRVVGDVDGEVF